MAVDLTKYSYQELVEEISDRLSNRENWGDAYNSSQGQTLVQLFADSVEQLHYQLERRTQENYFSTARLDSSIRGLANSVAYSPRRNVSSSGTVSLTILDSDGNITTPEGNIFIPRYTLMSLEGYSFVNTEDVLVTSDDSTVEFTVIEGTPRSEQFDPNESNTILNERGYVLFKDYENIEDGSIRIIDSDNNEWQYVKNNSDGTLPSTEALSFANPDDLVFDIRISTDGLRIVFGNDTFGKAPEQPITIEWVESSGEELSIMNTGLDLEFVNYIVEDDLNTVPVNEYGYTLTNSSAITGGISAETNDDIRIKAPEYFKTANRAVTREDFNYWVLESGIGGIVAVNTYGEQEVGVDVFNMNNVYIVYLNNVGRMLTPTEEESLRVYLKPISYLNAHPVFEPADIIDIQMNIKIHKNSSIRISDAEIFRYLRNELNSLFEFTKNSFNNDLFHSEMIEYLHNKKITVNNVTNRIAKFVTLDIKALSLFSTPFEENEVDVTFSLGSTGDVYRLDLSSDYDADRIIEYTQGSDDTVTNILNYFETELNNLSFYTASVTSNTLTIGVDGDEGSFYIQNENSTVTDNIMIKQNIAVPVKKLKNITQEQMIQDGSVEVIDTDGNILTTDDGSGNLFGGDGSVDYVTGEVIIPLLSTGDYYVRFQQNETQNIITNERTVLRFIEPKLNYTDTNEELTTIEFVD